MKEVLIVMAMLFAAIGLAKAEAMRLQVQPVKLHPRK